MPPLPLTPAIFQGKCSCDWCCLETSANIYLMDCQAVIMNCSQVLSGRMCQQLLNSTHLKLADAMEQVWKLYVHPVSGFPNIIVGKLAPIYNNDAWVQSLFFQIKSNEIHHNQKWICFELWAASCTNPQPFLNSLHSHGHSAQDPLKSVDRQSWNGLGFDHRKARLLKFGGPLNTLGSQRQKIF